MHVSAQACSSRFPHATAFDQRAQEYELEHLKTSHHGQVALAEQYAGLSLEEQDS